jgi:hypothetical protein
VGDDDAAFDLNVEVEHDDAIHSFELSTTKRELRGNDLHRSAFKRFSAPKLKIHEIVPENAYAFSGEFKEETEKGDFYFLKVTQSDGQMAWSSPIFIV